MPDNVDVVKREFEAVKREGWQALRPLMHPEFELITSPDVAMEPGIEVDQPAVMLWTFRDGKAGWAEVFADRERALEAAELDPPTPSGGH